MKKDNNITVLFVCLIAVTIVAGLSLTYATITRKLEVIGYATMNTGNWDVHFVNLQRKSITGNTVENVKPQITKDATSISMFDVDFYEKGDSITYSFDVVNDGGLDAVISSINIPKPVCSSSGDDKGTNNKLVCDNLIYSLTYSDGTAVNVEDELLSGHIQRFILTLKYNGKSLPTSAVDISDLNITILYSQK